MTPSGFTVIKLSHGVSDHGDSRGYRTEDKVPPAGTVNHPLALKFSFLWGHLQDEVTPRSSALKGAPPSSHQEGAGSQEGLRAEYLRPGGQHSPAHLGHLQATHWAAALGMAHVRERDGERSPREVPESRPHAQAQGGAGQQLCSVATS